MGKKILYLSGFILLTFLCWLVATRLWGNRGLGVLIPLAAACGLLIIGLVWAIRKLTSRVWQLIGLVVLAGLLYPTHRIMEHSRGEGALDQALSLALFFWPAFAILVAAMLLASGLKSGSRQPPGAGVSDDSRATGYISARADAAISFALCALLLARTLHNLYWLTMWDNTDDPLGYLWLVVPILAALLAGFVLAIALEGRAKLAGLYALLVPALMIAVSARAQSHDFRQVTRERGENASQAIEAFFVREGYYPNDLRQVRPWYAASLAPPLVIYGQDWCYQVGENYYRLGYVYREHWSDPNLRGEIVKSTGGVPDLPALCLEEMKAIKRSAPGYYHYEGE